MSMEEKLIGWKVLRLKTSLPENLIWWRYTYLWWIFYQWDSRIATLMKDVNRPQGIQCWKMNLIWSNSMSILVSLSFSVDPRMCKTKFVCLLVSLLPKSPKAEGPILGKHCMWTLFISRSALIVFVGWWVWRPENLFLLWRDLEYFCSKLIRKDQIRKKVTGICRNVSLAKKLNFWKKNYPQTSELISTYWWNLTSEFP